MKKYAYLGILFLAIFFSILGLLHRGFFISDDGNWMVIRFSAFYEAIRGGQIPVRFLPRLYLGYGYPVADFLYPLFMYFGLPIKLIGVGFVNSIKIILGLSMISSGIFFFLWLRKLFKEIASLVGSVAYVLFPYHLWDLYKRGSVGEILALSIVPFVLWQIEQKSILLISISIAFLITSHNTLAMLFLPIIFIYGFLRKTLSIKKLIISFVTGLGLSAFFWIPAFYDRQFTVFDKTIISEFANYFDWKLGLNLLGVISVVSLIGGKYVIYKKRNSSLIFFFCLFIISLFFSLPFSKSIWNILPGANFIQFPFRFLSITTLSGAYLISAYINFLSKKLTIPIAAAVLIIVFVSSWQFLMPKNFQYLPDSYYTTNVDSTTVKNEYLPIWYNSVKNRFPIMRPNAGLHFINLVAGMGSIKESFRGTSTKAKLNMFQDSYVRANFLYFPGWEVRMDNKTVPIEYKTTGIVTFRVPRGEHNLSVSFKETKERLFADFISVFSFIGLLIYGLTKKKYV